MKDKERVSLVGVSCVIFIIVFLASVLAMDVQREEYKKKEDKLNNLIEERDKRYRKSAKLFSDLLEDKDKNLKDLIIQRDCLIQEREKLARIKLQPIPSRGKTRSFQQLRTDESENNWIPLIRKYFPPDTVSTAFQIMMAESSGNPFAENPSSASGLFQVTAETWAGCSPYPWNDRFDPEKNIHVAAILYGGRGWQPWKASGDW